MKLTSVRGHGHLSVGQHEWSHCTGGNIGPSPVSASPRPSQRDISCPEIGRSNSGHDILNRGFYWLNDPCPYFQRPERDKFLGSPWEIKSSSESWLVCVPNPRPIAKICWGKTINTFPCQCISILCIIHQIVVRVKWSYSRVSIVVCARITYILFPVRLTLKIFFASSWIERMWVMRWMSSCFTSFESRKFPTKSPGKIWNARLRRSIPMHKLSKPFG